MLAMRLEWNWGFFSWEILWNCKPALCEKRIQKAAVSKSLVEVTMPRWVPFPLKSMLSYLFQINLISYLFRINLMLYLFWTNLMSYLFHICFRQIWCHICFRQIQCKKWSCLTNQASLSLLTAHDRATGINVSLLILPNPFQLHIWHVHFRYI